jgi:hypothetical protein
MSYTVKELIKNNYSSKLDESVKKIKEFKSIEAFKKHATAAKSKIIDGKTQGGNDMHTAWNDKDQLVGAFYHDASSGWHH